MSGAPTLATELQCALAHLDSPCKRKALGEAFPHAIQRSMEKNKRKGKAPSFFFVSWRYCLVFWPWPFLGRIGQGSGPHEKKQAPQPQCLLQCILYSHCFTNIQTDKSLTKRSNQAIAISGPRTATHISSPVCTFPPVWKADDWLREEGEARRKSKERRKARKRGNKETE